MGDSMRTTLRKLEKLTEKCGVSKDGKKKDEAPQVDTTKMTPYEKQQYYMATDMKKIRDTVQELEDLGEKATNTQKAELSNAIRKDVMNLKNKALEAKKHAMKENRREEYDALIGHMKKTELLFRQRIQKTGGGDDAGIMAAPTNSGTKKLGNIDEEMTAEPMMSLRDDEEFQLFYQQTKQNDVKIDQALDRISAGVTRLADNAKMMNQELKVQKALLDTAEQKVDRAEAALIGLNKKLKTTINEVDKDKMCIYAFCLLLILGLIGGIYYVVSGQK